MYPHFYPYETRTILCLITKMIPLCVVLFFDLTTDLGVMEIFTLFLLSYVLNSYRVCHLTNKRSIIRESFTKEVHQSKGIYKHCLSTFTSFYQNSLSMRLTSQWLSHISLENKMDWRVYFQTKQTVTR